MSEDSDFDDDTIAAIDELLCESDRSSQIDPVQPRISLPEDFCFPYDSPYDIQRKFMDDLFRALATPCSTILESPTGTGKSMSLICGALTWLKVHREQTEATAKESLQAASKSIRQLDAAEDDDWLGEGLDKKRSLIGQRDEAKEIIDSFDAAREKLAKIRVSIDRKSTAMTELNVSLPSRKRVIPTENSDEDDHDDFVVDDYHSDSESRSALDPPAARAVPAEEKPDNHRLQIFYCSRTHSQLAQFASEFRKTAFSKQFSCVTLGSRQTLCVNPSVRKLQSVSLMNERCMELQKGGKAAKTSEKLKKQSNSRCPFYKIQSISDYADELLVTDNVDIEDLGKEAQNRKACPYFVSRFAAKSADLVLMPYQLLLHKPSREACGISLKNNVIIVDEAHNLIDALSSVNSCILSTGQLRVTEKVLSMYLHRYKERLKAKNLLYIRQLIDFVKGILVHLSLVTSASAVYGVFELLVAAKLDNINTFKLLKYLRKSELSRKLVGFTRKIAQSVSDGEQEQSCPLPLIESLLSCLSNPCDDGRFVITRTKPDEFELKYILLNPLAPFRSVAKECRAMTLAGGTMRPLGDLERLLSRDGKLPTFHAYDHVVPKSNIFAAIVSQGPSGELLNFSFSNRDSVVQMHDVAKLLVNVCQRSYGGVVCFFPSYAFERKVFDFLSANGYVKSLSDMDYPIFREPKTTSESETVLTKFSKTIATGAPKGRGAVMFAVVGGKLSEGINFSDNLGRVVMMFGLPFPNTKSPELQERIRFASKLRGTSVESEFMEDLCMKAVNQSIGRVIRHARDYGAILLVDSRYDRASIRGKLPRWISDCLVDVTSSCSVLDGMRGFFQTMAAI